MKRRYTLIQLLPAAAALLTMNLGAEETIRYDFSRELPKWKLQKVKDAPARKFARGKCGSIGHHAVFTPRVKAFSKAEAGEASVIRLVPYGTTRLRIAIFPVIR